MRSIYVRRCAIGLVAGVAGAGLRQALLGGFDGVSTLVGAVLGIAYALGFETRRAAFADSTMVTAALGIPVWLVLDVLARPWLAGSTPQ